MAKFSSEPQGQDKELGGQQPQQQKTYTEEEVQKLLQAESDKRVSQALETAKKKAEEEKQNALKEYERLANLSAEERANEERRKYESTLKEKEKELTKRELKLEAIKQMDSKNLPLDFIDVVLKDNAEETFKAISTLGEQWQKSIELGVNTRLKGKTPEFIPGKPTDPVDKISALLDKEFNLKRKK